MKQLINILFIFFLIHPVFSQKQNLYTQKEVKEMPVFPGCEGVNPKRKTRMQACITEKITSLLSNKLINFNATMAKHELSSVTAEIQFVFSKEGIILGINSTEDSHPLLADAVVQALNSISDNLPRIRPARIKSGESVNMYYNFPIQYKLKEIDPRPNYLSDNIVLFTLQDKDKDYEIRLTKSNSIKVFEQKGEQETYLGRFLSLKELSNSEPYKQLIEYEFSNNKTLITKGYLNGEFHEIYIYNLFDKKLNPHIEVIRYKDDSKSEVITFKQELDFSQSIYAPLIYR